MSNIQDEREGKCNEDATQLDVNSITPEVRSLSVTEEVAQDSASSDQTEPSETITPQCESSADAAPTTTLQSSDDLQSEHPDEVSPSATSGNWAEIKTLLEHLNSEFGALKDAFEIKLKYDQHKETVIDRQHKELEGYRTGLIDRLTLQIANDVIQEIDNIENLAEHYTSFSEREDNGLYKKYEKLREHFIGIAESLRDMLGQHDIVSYKGEKKQLFDPRRQRVLKKEITSDQTLDKTVKQSWRWGFSFKEKIIRPELVEVYIWQPPQPSVIEGHAEPLPQ